MTACPDCRINPAVSPTRQASRTAQSFEWYSEGQARTIEVGGVRITIQLVGRKGRRARIRIVAPPGASFGSTELANS